MEYKPGRTNAVADALSRKAELAAISSPAQDRIRKKRNPEGVAKSLIDGGKVRKFWLKDGLLRTKRKRLYVPRWDNLRRDVLRE